jgi:hypothetical protein
MRYTILVLDSIVFSKNQNEISDEALKGRYQPARGRGGGDRGEES